LAELPLDENDISSFLCGSACVEHLKLNLQTSDDTTRTNTLIFLNKLIYSHSMDVKKTDIKRRFKIKRTEALESK
jgi:hypothetical protein